MRYREEGESRVEIAVLGPVEIRVGGRLVVVDRFQRRLLVSVLALCANTVVPTERVIDALWDDGALPARPRNQVQVHIRALRLAMADDAHTVVETCPAGYRLNAPPADVDLRCFDRAVAEAEVAVAAGRLVEAGTGLRRGLNLWRGPVCAGLDCRFVQDEAVGLAERRRHALHLRLGVDLALGRYEDLVGDLIGLVNADGFDDGLRWKLMLALYGQGRAGDALRSYRDGQRVLHEAGIEPGRELRAVCEAICNGRPVESIVAQFTGLTPPALLVHGQPAGPPPQQLAADIGDFTGRAQELDQLLAAVKSHSEAPHTTPFVVAIDGMAGIGKTTFAMHVAHLLAADYSDVQLAVDLHAHTVGQPPRDPGIALDVLLRALGVSPERIPADVDQRAAVWRAALAGRRAVIVLDNVADVAQVRPLLPATPGCVVLVTSRRRLVDLDSAVLLSLDAMTNDDAHALFGRIVGEARLRGQRPAAEDVLALCDRLPLAIRIAAARLRHRPAWTVGDLATRLRGARAVLAELSLGSHSVATAFALSYQQLDADHRRVFRLLGLHPGYDIDAGAAAALADRPVSDVERMLENLLDAHLVRQEVTGRYTLHNLVRYFASQCAEHDEPARERSLAVDRLLVWYLARADAADRVLLPRRRHVDVDSPGTGFETDQEALAWCEAERVNLPGVVRAAGAARPVLAWQLVASLGGFFYLRKHWREQIVLSLLGLAAAERAGDEYGQAVVLHDLGVAYAEVKQGAESVECYERSLRIRQAIDDRYGLGQTLNGLGNVWRDLGDVARAIDYLRQGLVNCREIGNRYGQASCLNNIGAVYWDQQRYEQAIEHYQEARMIWCQLGDRLGESFALHNLGEAYADIRRFTDAIGHLEQALVIRKEIGSRWGEAQTTSVIGTTYRSMDRLDEARESWRRALAIFEELGDPRAVEVRAQLAALGG